MRLLGRLLLVVVVLVLVTAALYLREPIWLDQQATHLGLFAARVQSNYVLTPEGRVHYYEAEPHIPGGGVPLVLVHGFADRGESWSPMLKRLKRAGFHVYAPDLLGFGRSPKPENGDYSMDGQAKFVYDFIQALGLQKTHIGGWSMGGWVVLNLAHEHPEAVDRVVIFDSAGLPLPQNNGMNTFQFKNAEDVGRWWAMMEPEAKPLPKPVREDLIRQITRNQGILKKGLEALENDPHHVDSFLPDLASPLLIVWGSRDGLIPLAAGERMHALDPHSELDIVEGCGHLVPELCAARVAPAVADYLRSNPAPEGGVRTLANMGRQAADR